MKTDILIAHPGKHHVLQLVSGCIKSGVDVKFITPFYNKGISNLFTFIPGSIGKKAKGYKNSRIPKNCIESPIIMLLSKIILYLYSEKAFLIRFDNYVAKKILQGRYQGKIFVSLQDYMPSSVKAARKKGMLIWSDQILNQSDDSQKRLKNHINKYSRILGSYTHDEAINSEILIASDIVTFPSMYTYEGIKDRVRSNCKLIKIPYGADSKRFKGSEKLNNNEITILVRAPSIRKGGHLFLLALEKIYPKLIDAIDNRKIKFIIIGQLENELERLLKKIKFQSQITVTHGNIPHSEIDKLYNVASFFIMPSLSEGSSLACIEAMHAGLPLLITNYCGIDSFVSGEMGYIVEDNLESIELSLINIFNNFSKWQHWGENTKRLGSTLTWENYEERICSLTRNSL